MKELWPMAWGVGVDIVDRIPLGDKPYEYHIIGDFVDNDSVVRNDYDLVVGNPPFSADGDRELARKFIRTGLECLNEYGLLGYILKTEAVHSEDRYEHIFKDNPPIEQWVLVKRPSWKGNGHSNTIEYSFFVWAKQNPAGYTKLRWLNWR